MIASIRNSSPILIVDDSDDDYEAAKRALKRNSNLANEIFRCNCGQDALDFLFHKGAYSNPEDAPTPGLILLDINMPGLDGYAVLNKLKADEKLKMIPVAMLTTSDDERDIEACYAAGASTYISKPVDLDGLFMAMKRLKEFWIDVALLPKT